MTEERTRYGDVELAEFKQLITDKLKKAEDELVFYKTQLSDRAHTSDAKLKGLDDGNVSAEVERLTGMASRQAKLIKHLSNALIRIENKVYGICRETGKLIAKERLRAVPHATLSIAAKMKRK